MRYAVSIVLVALAAINFYRAWAGQHQGGAEWFAGRGLTFAAEREDDPVAFTTAVWGNAVSGVLMLSIAGWTAFG